MLFVLCFFVLLRWVGQPGEVGAFGVEFDSGLLFAKSETINHIRGADSALNIMGVVEVYDLPPRSNKQPRYLVADTSQK